MVASLMLIADSKALHSPHRLPQRHLLIAGARSEPLRPVRLATCVPERVWRPHVPPGVPMLDAERNSMQPDPYEVAAVSCTRRMSTCRQYALDEAQTCLATRNGR